MFEISDATEGDIPAIIRIAEKTWWPTYSDILSGEQIKYMLNAIYAPETLRRQIVSKEQAYLILRDQQGAEGFASFALRGADTHVCKIHKLYVLPGNQRKGYGHHLICAIQDRLRRKNIHIVDLNVNRFNPARSFYERLGFRIIREEDVPIGPYWMNDYVMRLEF